MVYSEFNENMDENEEVIVSNQPANTTTSSSAQKDISLTVNHDNANITSAITQSQPQSPQILQVTTTHAYCANSPTTVYTPYINRNHLKCLDISNLERNMQIRHDIVLDPTYRALEPTTLMGENEQEEYWAQIKQEITDIQVSEGCRLKSLIVEIREMMFELYPRCELVSTELVEFMDDVDFIIEQLRRNLLDISKFFHFLGQVMKKNCAPKRDEMVERMSSCSCPIEGLKLCLKLIELMKLDLANFKLDQMRPIISKTAVITEKAFFSSLFSSGKISIDLTTKWFKSTDHSESLGLHDNFINASIKLLVSPFVHGTTSVPETFILDKKRLIQFHGKFQDLCIIQCLLLIFKQSTQGIKRTDEASILLQKILKDDLFKLLESPHTQIVDISSLLMRSIKEFRGESLNLNSSCSDDSDHIYSSINKIISPDNELFLLVEKKLLSQIKSKITIPIVNVNVSVNNNSPETISGGGCGLSDLNVLKEVEELSEKFGKLLNFNWNVFEEIYKNIYN